MPHLVLSHMARHNQTFVFASLIQSFLCFALLWFLHDIPFDLVIGPRTVATDIEWHCNVFFLLYIQSHIPANGSPIAVSSCMLHFDFLMCWVICFQCSNLLYLFLTTDIYKVLGRWTKLLHATGANVALMSSTLSHRLVKACTAKSTKPRTGTQVRTLL